MAFDRAKDLANIEGRRRRYPAGDERSLEDVSNPHTLQDETRLSLGDRILKYRWSLLVYLIFGFAVLAVVVVFTSRYVPVLYRSEWSRRFFWILLIGGFGFFVGNRSARASIAERDELSLMKRDGLTNFVGEYRDALEGDFPVFIPIKGFSFLGLRTHYYTLEDLSPELARQASRRRDQDDRVVIRLHPGFSSVAKTDRGTKISQLCSDLDVDALGRESNVVATLPDIADEDRLIQVRDEILELEDKLSNAKHLQNVYQIQRNNAQDEAKQSRNQTLDEFLEWYRGVREVDDRRTRDVARNGDVLGAEPSIRSVEAEVTPDDD